MLMLYLNLRDDDPAALAHAAEPAIGLQYAVRAMSVAAVLACVTGWAGYSALRVDATREQLFSLSSRHQRDTQ